jgi:hypothetical protein
LAVVFELGFVFIPGVPAGLVPLPGVPEVPELVVPEPEVVPELLLPVAPPLPALAPPPAPPPAPLPPPPPPPPPPCANAAALKRSAEISATGKSRVRDIVISFGCLPYGESSARQMVPLAPAPMQTRKPSRQPLIPCLRSPCSSARQRRFTAELASGFCLVEQGYGVCGARDESAHAGQQQQLVDLGHGVLPRSGCGKTTTGSSIFGSAAASFSKSSLSSASSIASKDFFTAAGKSSASGILRLQPRAIVV